MTKLTFLFALLLCAALAGCNQPAAPQGGVPSDAVSAPPAAESDPPATAPADAQTVTLYIGTKAGGFAEYPITCEGELTPELLIQGIADLTGWDLTLAEPVISGKGGMRLCLSSEAALFTGPLPGACLLTKFR